MAWKKAYLNVLLRVEGTLFVPVKTNIGTRRAGELPTEHRDCIWVTVFKVEAETFAEARHGIKFMLDRGAMRQIPPLVLLKSLVEKSTGKTIGDGTVFELMPPGK